MSDEQQTVGPAEDKAVRPDAGAAAPAAPTGDGNVDFSLKVEDRPLVAARSHGPRLGVLQMLWALLDFRVQRYLTPYIIRIYWVLALVVFMLYGIGIAIDVIAEGPASAFQSSDPSDEAIRQLLGQSPRYDSEHSDIVREYDRFKNTVIKYISVFCLLLAARVSCELMAVGFNMANSLKSIEIGVAKLNDQRQPLRE